MTTILQIAFGGFLGGSLRYLLCRLPHGLLLANTIACFLLGLSQHSPFLAVSIAGALSTWSSLAAHLGPLLRTSRAQFVRSICATTLCGYAAILIGLSV